MLHLLPHVDGPLNDVRESRSSVSTMGLRDALIGFVRSRTRGRVVHDGKGGSTYQPPGTRVRALGDWIAFLGAVGYVLPAFGAYSIITKRSAGFPRIYPSIDPDLNLAILTVLPLVAIPFVVLGVAFKRPLAKFGLAAIGLLGTILTWPINDHILTASMYGAGPLIGLSAGSWLILTGGLLSVTASYFGKLVKEYDKTPKTQ